MVALSLDDGQELWRASYFENYDTQLDVFVIRGVEEAIARIKDAIRKTYGKKGGGTVVERNFAAVDGALDALEEVAVPDRVTSTHRRHAPVSSDAPEFVKEVLGEMIAYRGDDLPVSALPVDGTFPSGTTRYEKRGTAQSGPIGDPEICTQCGLCSLVCPHAAIRMKAFELSVLDKAPEEFRSADWRGKDFPGWKMTVQVAPEDCVSQTCDSLTRVASPRHQPRQTRAQSKARILASTFSSDGFRSLSAFAQHMHGLRVHDGKKVRLRVWFQGSERPVRHVSHER